MQTERDKPTGQIVPIDQSTKERLERLRDAGLIAWSGKQWSPSGPLVQIKGEKSIAELLIEDRE